MGTKDDEPVGDSSLDGRSSSSEDTTSTSNYSSCPSEAAVVPVLPDDLTVRHHQHGRIGNSNCDAATQTPLQFASEPANHYHHQHDRSDRPNEGNRQETGSAGGDAGMVEGVEPADCAKGAEQQRTGNAKGPHQLGPSVGSRTPDIPNVVEYHLVKPRCARDQVTSSQRMKNPSRPTASTTELIEDQRRELTLQLSKLSIDSNVYDCSCDLPQIFQVKYLGSQDARGLWGLRHTRKPVESMVAAAKSLPNIAILPFMKLVISEDGVGLLALGKNRPEAGPRLFPIETISYGVQDLVYTRVFSIIVVRDTDDFRRKSPFECHGFVCESKPHARQMTYALAAAFQIYSQHVQAQQHQADRERASSTDNAANSDDNNNNNKHSNNNHNKNVWTKGFAIDMRNPNEFQANCTIQYNREGEFC